MKIKCTHKTHYMLCEVGDILEVEWEGYFNKRFGECYGVKFKRVIGIYPKKYFETVEE